MVQSSIEGPLYAVSFFAICLILLLDTSGCKSSGLLRRNCHGLLLGFYDFLIDVSAKEKLLIEAFFFQHAFLDLCLNRAPLVLAENTGLFCFWVVKEYAFWVKTRKDASSLPDMFLDTLPYLGSTGVAKCVSITLLVVERDSTIICVLLYFRPTGSPRYLWLS